MSNLLTAERIKILKGKKISIVMAIFILLPLIQVANSWLTVYFGGELDLAKDIVVDGASGILMMKKNAFTIYAIAIGLTSFFVGEEFQYGTIRNTLALGHSRSQYYFSKGFIISIVIFIGTIVMTLLGMLTYSMVFGFQEIPNVDHYLSYAVQAFLVQSLVILANTSIYVMIVFICKNVGISLLWMFVYTVGAGFVPGLFQNTERLAFLSDWFAETFLFYYDFTVQQTIEKFPFMIVVSLITVVVSSIIGTWLFKRTDIK